MVSAAPLLVTSRIDTRGVLPLMQGMILRMLELSRTKAGRIVGVQTVDARDSVVGG